MAEERHIPRHGGPRGRRLCPLVRGVPGPWPVERLREPDRPAQKPGGTIRLAKSFHWPWSRYSTNKGAKSSPSRSTMARNVPLFSHWAPEEILPCPCTQTSAPQRQYSSL